MVATEQEHLTRPLFPLKGHWRLLLSLLLTTLGGLFLMRNITATLDVNAADVAYMHLITTRPEAYEEQYRTRTLPDVGPTGELLTALEYARSAASISPDNSGAQWTLGRIALAAGNYREATSALSPLVSRVRYNTLLYTDLLVASSQSDLPTKTVELFSEYGNPSSQVVVSDTVAVSYLQLAEPFVLTGDVEAAAPFLQHVLNLRPTDLYAAYYLMQCSLLRGDQPDVARLRGSLSHFTLAAIRPSDPRLVTYATKVIPDLVSRGIWTETVSLNAISLLIVQGRNVDGVRLLASVMADRYPHQVQWRFLLGEWYQQAGRLDEAVATYKRVLQEDPTFHGAYYRLGSICEDQAFKASTCTHVEALRWLQIYHRLAPDDLQGLKELIQLETRLGQLEPSLMKELSTVSNISPEMVAPMLKVAATDVVIGANLLPSGTFDQWAYSKPVDWYPWQVPGAAVNDTLSNDVAFSVTPDRMTAWQGTSVRVDGFWLEQHTNLNPEHWGLREIQHVNLAPHSTYVFSLFYRYETPTGAEAALFISDDPKLSSLGRLFYLPPHGEGWQRFVAIVDNTSVKSIGIAPILLSFAPAPVWFDEFEVRPVTMTAQSLQASPTTWLILP